MTKYPRFNTTSKADLLAAGIAIVVLGGGVLAYLYFLLAK